jgi:hypothetical protein
MWPAVSQHAAMSNATNPPKQRGCLFYGCLSLSIVALIGLALIVGGYFLAKSTANRWIREYTDTAPVLVEKFEYPPAAMEALRTRVAEFKTALDRGTNQVQLVLTADELNALIAQEKSLQGKVFIRLNGDTIQGEVSVPLKDVGPLKLNGRYLNGTATFKVALDNGVLDVRLQDMQVKGKPLPAMLFEEFKKQNLARDVQNNPENAASIARFESLQITNGTVVLRNRLSAPDPANPPGR